LAGVTVLFALFIRRSKPPTPSAASHDDGIEIPGFLQGVKLCFRSKTYWILAVCLGGGVGLFNALYNNLQPALCVMGYSLSFSGGMGTLLIMSGLVGAAISGLYVDKTGKFEQTMKFSFLLAGVAACSLAVSINYEGQEGWVVASIFLFGAFGFAIYPIGLEMGVEATFPVAEATSTGLIIMIGQIQGVIYVILTNVFVGKPDPHQLAVQTCVDKNSGLKGVVTWSVPFLIWSGCVCTLIISFVILFWPKYKRREYEASQAGRVIQLTQM
uniref:MFS domain-containing protein n=1 Tax=Heligmosomoides polygyrus TaxID=6339 RepID=A0A183G1H9_HELPZ